MQTRQARQRTVMPQTQVTSGGLAVQAAVTTAPGPRACDSRSEERVLDDSPLNAAHRLDAVAQALGTLMALAHRRVELPPPEFRRRFGCQDVAEHGDFLCDFDRRWRSLREQTGRLLAPSDPPDRADCPDA